MSRYNYYEYFEKIMNYCKEEKDYMVEAVRNLDNLDFEKHLLKMHEVEHNADILKRDMISVLAKDFIPIIEREDMLILAKYMDNIIDNIEDIIKYIRIHDIKRLDKFMLELVNCVDWAVEALGNVIFDLKNFKNSENISRYIRDVGDFESKADKIFFNGMTDLYNKKEEDYYMAIARRTMYEIIEETVNSCEEAAYFIEVIQINNF